MRLSDGLEAQEYVQGICFPPPPVICPHFTPTPGYFSPVVFFRLIGFPNCFIHFLLITMANYCFDLLNVLPIYRQDV
jgi:hypothetical protein